MFKANNQPDLFSFETQLLDNEQQKLLDKTPEKAFYNLIFTNIKESDYKAIFSDKISRPNAPVNILISALILKERKSLSYDELMASIMFDMRTKIALGLSSIDYKPFRRATIFNFQNRLSDYEQETGINLLEKTFDNLTAGQLKKLKIKTDIQRTDSGLISSNIRKYSRIQLLIEVLLRLSRLFDDADKDTLSEQIKPYSKLGCQKYVYTLKSSNLTHELKKLGELYYSVYQYVKIKYSGSNEFRVFEKAYNEHFTIIEGVATAKPNNELNSSMLQSPDDEDATYRKKRDQESKGFTINATETANPDNDIQLLTDICSGCSLKEECNIFKNKGIYYVTHSDFFKNKRNNNIIKIPKERRKIRPNVAATIKEFKGKQMQAN